MYPVLIAMWSHNTISHYGLLDAWPRHYARKFGDENENKTDHWWHCLLPWHTTCLQSYIYNYKREPSASTSAWRGCVVLGYNDSKKEKVPSFIAVTQQPIDSLILVAFLICSANEHFDQGEIQSVEIENIFLDMPLAWNFSQMWATSHVTHTCKETKGKSIVHISIREMQTGMGSQDACWNPSVIRKQSWPLSAHIIIRWFSPNWWPMLSHYWGVRQETSHDR